MGIERLDHVNLRTKKLDQMIDWYGRILDMHPGYRPDFGFPGAWLYANEQALIHLVAIEGDAATGSETDLKMEHVAFSARDMATFEAHLTETDTRFEKVAVPGTEIVQFNVWDPDGNHLHIDFVGE